jgi:hypothetical protein
MPTNRGGVAARLYSSALTGVFLGLHVSLASHAVAQQPELLPPTEVRAPRMTEPMQPEPEPMPPPLALFPGPEPGRSAPVGNGMLAPPSASAGFFTQAEIQNFPLLRTTEFLELVPGLLVTQHSGGLKANQYFLRGYSLDHGTDFAGFVDDVPYNLPTHAHGQGYLDLNSVIPELIDRVDFRKGPYYADVGDFSTTGSVDIHYMDRLPYGFWLQEAGKNDWIRTVVASSGNVGQGTLLFGVENLYYNGPYQVPENQDRVSAVFRYTLGDQADGLRVTAYVYNGSGNDNNQIPQRAVYQGLVSSLGNLDPSDFLTTQRYTLNGQWWHKWDSGAETRANAYAYYYSLDIFNDFTFFLQDPIHGDQNDQIDRRWVTGGNIAHTWNSLLIGECAQNTVGLQLRNDSIPHVGLHHTEDRELVNVVTDDSVDDFDGALYYQNQMKWSEKVRTVVGVRADYIHFDVHDWYVPQNSGTIETSFPSPKGSLILGPWNRTNFFLNGGYDFHSDDARGTLEVLTPSFVGPPPNYVGQAPPTPSVPTPQVARTRGCEIGFRSQAIPNLTSEAALWQIHSQQELVFDGDTGTTTPLRASERYGIEWSNTYYFSNWLTLNGDYSWSHGRLLGIDPEVPGQFIPEAITTTFSGGPSIRLPSGWFADLRCRYFGPRPLIEDNSASSRATTTFDLETGYQCKRFRAGLAFLNLFNSNGHDIDYFYGTGLKTDPGFPFPPGANGINDINFKQVEPFAVRAFLTLRW